MCITHLSLSVYWVIMALDSSDEQNKVKWGFPPSSKTKQSKEEIQLTKKWNIKLFIVVFK